MQAGSELQQSLEAEVLELQAQLGRLKRRSEKKLAKEIKKREMQDQAIKERDILFATKEQELKTQLNTTTKLLEDRGQEHQEQTERRSRGEKKEREIQDQATKEREIRFEAKNRKLTIKLSDAKKLLGDCNQAQQQQAKLHGATELQLQVAVASAAKLDKKKQLLKKRLRDAETTAKNAEDESPSRRRPSPGMMFSPSYIGSSRCYKTPDPIRMPPLDGVVSAYDEKKVTNTPLHIR